MLFYTKHRCHDISFDFIHHLMLSATAFLIQTTRLCTFILKYVLNFALKLNSVHGFSKAKVVLKYECKVNDQNQRETFATHLSHTAAIVFMKFNAKVRESSDVVFLHVINNGSVNGTACKYKFSKILKSF